MTSEVVGRPAPTTKVGRFELTEHHCFGCGTLNTNGLGMRLHIEPGRSWAHVELDARFEGWKGTAHGGILATVLDEVMAWALVGDDNWGVTARLNVRFREPVPIGVRLRADGWTTRSRRRLVETAARLVDLATGKELATATGVYIAADAAQKRELQERYGFRWLDASAGGGDAFLDGARP